MRFGQGLIQSLVNPGYGQGLFQLGSSLGQQAAGVPQEVARQAQEEQSQQEAQQRGMFELMQLGQNTPAGSPQFAKGVQAFSNAYGVPFEEAMAAASQGQQQQTMAREQQLATTAAERNTKFTNSIAQSLESKGENTLASVVRNAPDVSGLPDKVQERIFNSIGLSPEEGRKALSPEGKLVMDMYPNVPPGTAAFGEKVQQIYEAKGSSQDSSQQFSAIADAVSKTVDLEKNVKINDAVVALELGGRAGAESIQQQTIIDIFGSRQRAIAALTRFEQSASLPRRVTDSLAKFFRGEVTQLTQDDRESIVYAALKQQEASIQTAVENAAVAVNIPQERAAASRRVFDFPSTTQEWVRRYEEKNLSGKEEATAASTEGWSIVE